MERRRASREKSGTSRERRRASREKIGTSREMRRASREKSGTSREMRRASREKSGTSRERRRVLAGKERHLSGEAGRLSGTERFLGGRAGTSSVRIRALEEGGYREPAGADHGSVANDRDPAVLFAARGHDPLGRETRAREMRGASVGARWRMVVIPGRLRVGR